MLDLAIFLLLVVGTLLQFVWIGFLIVGFWRVRGEAKSAGWGVLRRSLPLFFASAIVYAGGYTLLALTTK